jgi:hypothetical protein
MALALKSADVQNMIGMLKTRIELLAKYYFLDTMAFLIGFLPINVRRTSYS